MIFGYNLAITSSYSNLTQDDLIVLSQFRDKFHQSRLFQQVETRLALLRYDDAASDLEKQAALTAIVRQAKLVSVTLDHVRPEHLQRSDDSQSSQSEDESSLGEGFQFNFGALPQQHLKPTSKFEYERYFSKQAIQERFQA